jgi:hypothetical protein
MSATNQVTEISARLWKAKEIELRDLKTSATASIYRRAVLGNEIFNDAEYRTDNGVADDSDALAKLSRFFDDLCVSFGELQTILKHFPVEADWKIKPLRILLEEATAANTKKIESSPRSTQAETKEDLRRRLGQIERQKIVAEAKHDQVAEENRQVRSERDRLLFRIQELETENASLKKQVEELKAKIKASRSRQRSTVAA